MALPRYHCHADSLPPAFLPLPTSRPAPGAAQGCAPTSPDNLVLTEKEGKPQGFPISLHCPGAATHAASISTNVTFSLRGRKKWWVCWCSSALFTRLNNSSVTWCHTTAGWCLIPTKTKSAPHPTPRDRGRMPTCTPKEERPCRYPPADTRRSSHRIPPPERPPTHPGFPLTCFLQVHGGGCLHRCGHCRLAGGHRWLLRGRRRGPVLALLPLLARRLLQGLCPREETGQRAEMQQPCTSWWTRCQQPAFHRAGQEERAGRRAQRTGQRDLGKPPLRGILALGSCHDEFIALLLVLPINNDFPQLGHAVILNITYFSLCGLKIKDPGLQTGLNVKLLAGELWLR